MSLAFQLKQILLRGYRLFDKIMTILDETSSSGFLYFCNVMMLVFDIYGLYIEVEAKA